MKQLLVIIAVLSSFSLFAQAPQEIDDVRLLYRHEHAGGFVLHSHGWGVNYRFSANLGDEAQRQFQFDMVGLHHSKEVKVESFYAVDGKKFVYGKDNATTLFRGSIGRLNTISGKELKNGVRVSYLMQFGVTLALLKPYYYRISEESLGVVSAPNLSNERFNLSTHTLDRIYGRSSYFYGLNEARIEPGLHGKFGFNFEYAEEDELVRALEAGVAVDAFRTPLPIMSQIENDQYYLTFYINILIGKKVK